MRRSSFLLWSVAGLLSGVLGWAIGDLFGSFFPQTVASCAAVGASMGLLARDSRTGLRGGLTAGITAALAFLVAGRMVTALVAWPASAFALGIVATFLLSRRRARIATALSSPILGMAGFIFGAGIPIALGAGFNDSRLVAEFMPAGAAGFGLFTLGGIRMLAGWLDRAPKATGESGKTRAETTAAALARESI